MKGFTLKKISITNLFGNLCPIIELKEGGVTFIHGPNGCGKTTVLRLIYALFNWETADLFETDFESIEIELDNASTLKVTKKFVMNDDTERAVPSLVFELIGLDSDIFELPRMASGSRSPISEIEEYLPFLLRVGPREWVDKTTGQRIDHQTILDKYGDRIPTLFRKQRPAWLSEYVDTVNMHFIKTQRLLKIDHIMMRRGRPEEPAVSDVIQLYSNEIKDFISEKLAEQAAISQLYDRSFPERLLSASRDELVTEDQIRLLYAETEIKIQKLVEAGLIDKQANIPLPDKTFADTEVKVLSLYLHDVNEKLNVFRELQNMIQVFLEVVAGKLRTKKFSVSRKDGFLIESLHKPGEFLSPTQLSSGEQHQIVLFYELIFKANKNSFFLIDEPEISLHVDWQRSFLGDIKKISSLGDRSFLIATHSPQIIGGHRELAVPLEEGILENN